MDWHWQFFGLKYSIVSGAIGIRSFTRRKMKKAGEMAEWFKAHAWKA
jgi:hypothetical protein